MDPKNSMEPRPRHLPLVLTGYVELPSKKKFTIRADTKETIFAAEWETDACKAKGATVLLFDGPSSESPMISATRGGSLDKAWNVQLSQETIAGHQPPSAGHTGDSASVTVTVQPVALAGNTHVYHFETSVAGGNMKQEKFEWRHNFDGNLQRLDSDWSYGWKLIWLSGPEGVAGSPGYTSSGRQVVASFTWISSWRLTKCFRFELTGHASQGDFGEDWAILALTSGMHIFCLDQRGGR